MPSISARLENALGSYFLRSLRGRDAKLFTKSAPFSHLAPSLDVTSPECGVSGSSLHIDHTPLGVNQFPELSWQQIDTAANDRGSAIKEYIVIVEDPDAPLPSPVVHGLYYAIPGSKTSLGPQDFEQVEEGKKFHLRGGFRYGMNRRQCIWSGARPVLGHGVHRYFFQVIGLSESLELNDGDYVTKKALESEVSGKIAVWGVWVGTFERKFGSNGE